MKFILQIQLKTLFIVMILAIYIFWGISIKVYAKEYDGGEWKYTITDDNEIEIY